MVAPASFRRAAVNVRMSGEAAEVELEFDAQNPMGVALRHRQVCRFLNRQGIERWAAENTVRAEEYLSNDQIIG